MWTNSRTFPCRARRWSYGRRTRLYQKRLSARHPNEALWCPSPRCLDGFCPVSMNQPVSVSINTIIANFVKLIVYCDSIHTGYDCASGLRSQARHKSATRSRATRADARPVVPRTSCTPALHRRKRADTRGECADVAHAVLVRCAAPAPAIVSFRVSSFVAVRMEHMLMTDCFVI